MPYTFLWRYTAVSCKERVIVFSLEVTLKRVCWPCKWKCEKRGGARGAMVIVVGTGHGDTSSNPGRD